MNEVTWMKADRALPWMVLYLSATALFGVGCQTQPRSPVQAANPALRPIVAPAGATMADTERAALARFVGVWNFEGWSSAQGSSRSAASGRAAGVIEDEHFILLDLAAASGQFVGRTGRKAGSMLFASEPGIGLTLTAWGDASPSITRLVGRVEGNGSVFSFDEVKTAVGLARHSLTITFEADDRWIAEIRDITASDHPVVARYQFTRAG